MKNQLNDSSFWSRLAIGYKVEIGFLVKKFRELLETERTEILQGLRHTNADIRHEMAEKLGNLFFKQENKPGLDQFLCEQTGIGGGYLPYHPVDMKDGRRYDLFACYFHDHTPENGSDIPMPQGIKE